METYDTMIIIYVSFMHLEFEREVLYRRDVKSAIIYDI